MVGLPLLPLHLRNEVGALPVPVVHVEETGDPGLWIGALDPLLAGHQQIDDLQHVKAVYTCGSTRSVGVKGDHRDALQVHGTFQILHENVIHPNLLVQGGVNRQGDRPAIQAQGMDTDLPTARETLIDRLLPENIRLLISIRTGHHDHTLFLIKSVRIHILQHAGRAQDTDLLLIKFRQMCHVSSLLFPCINQLPLLANSDEFLLNKIFIKNSSEKILYTKNGLIICIILIDLQNVVKYTFKIL